MTHMNDYPGKTEIVEIEEELNSNKHYRSNNSSKPEVRREHGDRRSLASNAGNISSLEEDLNQLFEIFNRKASPNGSSHKSQAGSSKRNSSKKPVKPGGSHSPGYGERLNLKQALRGLCISQASEMAATRRSMNSPRSSKAGRIMTMYRNVVGEHIISDHSKDDSREGLLEISLVPEQIPFGPLLSTPKKSPPSNLWPPTRSSLTDKAVLSTRFQNDGVLESNTTGSKISKPEKHVLGTSSFSPTANNSIRQVAKNGRIENMKLSSSVESGSQTFWTDSSQTGKCTSATSSSYSSYVQNSIAIAQKSPTQNILVAAAVEAGKRQSKVDMIHPDDSTFSRASSSKTSLDINRKLIGQQERLSKSLVRKQERLDMAHNEEHTPTRSPQSDNGEDLLDHRKNSAASMKVSAKVEAKELDRDVTVILKNLPSTSSPKGKKVSRSTKNAKHFVKPLIKTKSFVKRRTKKKSSSENSSKNACTEFNNDLYSSPNPIVCPRCQCMVTDTWKETNNGSSSSHPHSTISPPESPVSNQDSMVFYQDSPISPFASLSEEVSSGNVISDVSTPGPSFDGSNKSKTDLVEFYSNTSVGEESNLSRPSICDRPHMSNDVRWEAIRHVKFQHGFLSLKNFSLLKKLGCGDIGTVYLTELIGTSCLFAIKVMDNEFLARRKKITRAQTEKVILRMLDHPFLPTLYSQFTSDNLSCLVMEYCPGGDLHVLRQKQTGKCFTEQAARFYVAEVLLALEYLHMLGVVYRDLKPENILVREDGHIMLSDFDLSLRCAVSPTLLVSSSMSESSRETSHDSHRCSDSRCGQPLCMEPSCQVTCFTPRHLRSFSKSRKMRPVIAAEMRPLLQLVAEPTTARSNSFVGTHEYLAPEIIKGEGHGSAVDWWTYGIFLYELLYGKTPFKGAGNEETLANVVLESLKFPDSPLVSIQARDLIAALLVKEPENRLGTERGATEIKQHPFFDGLNWALIRCTVPPELPMSRDYGMQKTETNEKNNKDLEHSSGSGSPEHLEFEVF